MGFLLKVKFLTLKIILKIIKNLLFLGVYKIFNLNLHLRLMYILCKLKMQKVSTWCEEEN